VTVREDGARLGWVTQQGWPASEPLLTKYFNRGLMAREEYDTAMVDLRLGTLRREVL
jgi:hypothetical protein